MRNVREEFNPSKAKDYVTVDILSNDAGMTQSSIIT